MTLSECKSYVDKQKGKQETITSLLSDAKKDKRRLFRDLKSTEQAQVIIQTVAQQTQENLIYNIENIVTAALASVFDDPYEFKVTFNIKRNKTECNLYFKRGDEEVDPLNSSGYGAVDVASVALRVAAWALTNPKKRSCFILDEPARHLSTDLSEKFVAMIHELSHKLDIQFIIVSHIANISEFSDKVFRVSKSGLYSSVEDNNEKV